MEAILAKIVSWTGLAGSVVFLLLGYLSKKYILPFLVVGERYKYATYIAAMADEITDYLRAKYPEKKWLAQLDEGVDRLIEICGISREVAHRAVRAAAARK